MLSHRSCRFLRKLVFPQTDCLGTSAHLFYLRILQIYFDQTRIVLLHFLLLPVCIHCQANIKQYCLSDVLKIQIIYAKLTTMGKKAEIYYLWVLCFVFVIVSVLIFQKCYISHNFGTTIKVAKLMFIARKIFKKICRQRSR